MGRAGRRWVGLAAAILGAVASLPPPAAADVSGARGTRGDVSPLPVLGPAPDFHLPSLEGPRVRLRDLRGKLILLAFACASCADEPETVAAGFVRLQAALKQRGLFGGKVALAFVVRHPERETRAGFRTYALRLGVDPYGWVILGGSARTTERVQQEFGRFGAPAGNGADAMRGRVLLVDYAGRIRRVYTPETFRVEDVLADIEGLL